jgi:hypothetical protein
MRNEIKYTEDEIDSSQKNLEKLKKIGIIVTDSEFNAAVNGADGTPENGFNDTSTKATRRAKMWLLPNGMLLVEQEDEKKSTKCIIVPPTYKFARLFVPEGKPE